jgi:acyl-CoA synthetase (NDP forming)
VGAAVIFSAGFAEGGAEGLAAQQELGRIAAAHGMVIEGPNCLGMVNYIDGVALTFVETPAARLGDRRGVAIVSQSGAMAVVLGTTLISKGVPISISVSTGNEAASSVEDYIEYMLDEPGTCVIGMVVELFRQPARFLHLAARARAAGKTIVLLHPGKSSAARHSAATHTGAMAGDWQVMRIKVAHEGVILADSLEELGDVIEIALRCGRPGPGGTAVLTESGAFKAITLDLAEDVGLSLPEPGPGTTAALRAGLPDYIPVSNPMDLTAQGLVDPGIYGRTLGPLLDDPAFSSVVVGIIQTDPLTADRKFPALIAAISALATAKPVLLSGLDEGGGVPGDYITTLRDLGVPYFPTAERAIRALARLEAATWASHRSAPALVTLALPPGEVVPEYLAKRLLAPLGIAFPRGDLATTLEQALRIAETIGYPVVLKAQSAAVSHKSDVGGVVLRLGDAAAVAEGWARLHDNVARHLPDLALDGVLVEAMGAGGIELIIGARNDPEWGPVILAGMGGVQAEALGDVRLLPPDLDEPAIIRELRRLRAAALFDGFRGAPKVNLQAAARLIAVLGRVLLGTPAIREIDLNPVILDPAGATALDALIVKD